MVFVAVLQTSVFRISTLNVSKIALSYMCQLHFTCNSSLPPKIYFMKLSFILTILKLVCSNISLALQILMG